MFLHHDTCIVRKAMDKREKLKTLPPHLPLLLSSAPSLPLHSTILVTSRHTSELCPHPPPKTNWQLQDSVLLFRFEVMSFLLLDRDFLVKCFYKKVNSMTNLFSFFSL